MPTTGLRERKKVQTRRRIVDNAVRLFSERGFDATTVDEVADAAEISRRTFFRYFERKEDVALEWLDEIGRSLIAFVLASPAAQPPLESARHALVELVDVFRGRAEDALAVVRLIDETPAIRARERDKQAAWEDTLTLEFASRLSLDPKRDVWPRLAATVMIAVLNTAVATWRAQAGRPDLADLVEDAFRALSEASA